MYLPYLVSLDGQGKLHIEYLNTSEQYKSAALFANARQMLSQYQVKRANKEANTLQALYWPFTSLTPDRELQALANIRQALKNHDYEEAVSSW